MATTKSLDDLLLSFMQDVYYAERQILKALPKMVKASTNPQLQEAFTHHRGETEVQVERLQRAFEVMGKPARAQTCEAINGLIEEGEEVVDTFPQGPVRDAGLVACAQAVEHYEIARYGSLVAWAKAAGRKELMQLFEETLAEEKKADTLLTQLASKDINPQAMKAAA